ncbi:MAG: DUF4013 domain-containing protein [Parafannyhessea sp.]|uniref:DUF4013 domain-containing protein n=1 Tax=Parafannyhessea sp. TaxID=2847324 RepID=UPI003F112546
MSDKRDAYYSRSWKLLSHDKGWWKVLLVMGIADFVPVAGALGTFGYRLEWARLTAWGVDSYPKQKNVRVGECIKSGWRGFVGFLGWAVVWAIVYGGINRLANGNDTVRLLLDIATLFVGVLYLVVALRATVYQNFKAAYQVNRVWDMVKADFGGFAKIVGIGFLIGLIFGVILFVLGLAIFMPVLVNLFFGIGGMTSSSDLIVRMPEILSALSGVFPAIALLCYAASLAKNFEELIVTTAVGLWMRNFDVPHWGASKDPLPATAALPEPTKPQDPTQPPADGPATTPQPGPDGSDGPTIL